LSTPFLSRRMRHFTTAPRGAGLAARGKRKRREGKRGKGGRGERERRERGKVGRREQGGLCNVDESRVVGTQKRENENRRSFREGRQISLQDVPPLFAAGSRTGGTEVVRGMGGATEHADRQPAGRRASGAMAGLWHQQPMHQQPEQGH